MPPEPLLGISQDPGLDILKKRFEVGSNLFGARFPAGEFDRGANPQFVTSGPQPVDESGENGSAEKAGETYRAGGSPCRPAEEVHPYPVPCVLVQGEPQNPSLSEVADGPYGACPLVERLYSARGTQFGDQPLGGPERHRADEDPDRDPAPPQVRRGKRKVAQVTAQDDHPFPFADRFLKMFTAAHGNDFFETFRAEAETGEENEYVFEKTHEGNEGDPLFPYGGK